MTLFDTRTALEGCHAPGSGHTAGRPKAESKLTAGEKELRAKQKWQLDCKEDEHPGAPRKGAQHLSKTGARPVIKVRKQMNTR